MTLRLLHSEFHSIWGKFYFIFFYLCRHTQLCKIICNLSRTNSLRLVKALCCSMFMYANIWEGRAPSSRKSRNRHRWMHLYKIKRGHFHFSHTTSLTAVHFPPYSILYLLPRDFTPWSKYPRWRKTVHVVFKYLSRSLLSKLVGAGGVVPPLLTPPYFPAEQWIFHLKTT